MRRLRIYFPGKNETSGKLTTSILPSTARMSDMRYSTFCRRINPQVQLKSKVTQKTGGICILLLQGEMI